MSVVGRTEIGSGGIPHAVAWHDAECGAYTADLALWERLAGSSPGPVLDLGAGTGRVALHLAHLGVEVVAVDRDPVLVGELERRAAAQSLPVETETADVRELALGRRFSLAIAPMQLIQMIGDAAARGAALTRIAAHLEPDGTIAAVLLADDTTLASGEAETLAPDVREIDRWVHSSLPLEIRVEADRVEVVRLRQLVAPGGELSEELHVDRLQRLSLPTLAREAEAAGLRSTGSVPIAATDAHVGSVCALLEPRR